MIPSGKSPGVGAKFFTGLVVAMMLVVMLILFAGVVIRLVAWAF